MRDADHGIHASEPRAQLFCERAGEITTVDDALEIVTACVEQKTGRVLITHDRLPAEFFDLSTRFAGDFLQKLLNYRLMVALVLPPDRDYSERFREFASEARTGQDFRTFDSREDAEAWLLPPDWTCRAPSDLVPRSYTS